MKNRLAGAPERSLVRPQHGAGHHWEGSMSGLEVLYDKKAAEEQEWAEIPDRDKPGRLREVY